MRYPIVLAFAAAAVLLAVHVSAHDHAMDMEAAVRDWMAAHPARGGPLDAADVPADTFFVGNFYFDNDGNPADGRDTAVVQPGQSVLWKWVGGSHTTTSGTGPLDPQEGAIWNHAITSTSTSFVQAFPTEGTFPFFCGVHPGSMKGIVEVRQAVAVRPLPGGGDRIGFLADPAPNPSSGRVLFLFGLRSAGRARAEVFDARGRRVATPVDQDLGPGSYVGLWDGAGASPGAYYLKLTLPGSRETRKIVLAN